MTDYNKKLKELIKEAADHGYTFGSDNEFYKEPEFIYVMEMFRVWNSTYEETGSYNIFKHTFKITDDEYNQITDFGKKNNRIIVNNNNIPEDSKLCTIIEDIIYKYDTSYMPLMDCCSGGNISIRYGHYYNKYTKKYDAECVDLWLFKEDDNDEYPRGYISFYQIDKQDYINSQSIDLKVEKFLKDN